VLAAFLIVDIDGVCDEASANLTAADGQYLVQGGKVEILEWSCRSARLIAVRFDALQAARDWWNSPAYAELKSMRQRSTSTKMVIVEGLSNA
jgi:uncharacterized protein (DUF1330 family)